MSNKVTEILAQVEWLVGESKDDPSCLAKIDQLLDEAAKDGSPQGLSVLSERLAKKAVENPTDENKRIAYEALLKAAMHGCVRSMSTLAMRPSLYWDYIPDDLAQAYAWIKLSGDIEGELDGFAEDMSREELEQAERIYMELERDLASRNIQKFDIYA